MDTKVPELLDLTRKLLDQSVEIVNDSLQSVESVPMAEILYSNFLHAQISEALKFGYGAYHSCNNGWGHGGIGAARSIYEIFLDIKYINDDEARKDERFERFVDHLAQARYDQMKRNLGIGKEIPEETQHRIKHDYEQLKKKYKDKHEQDLNSGKAKVDATPKYNRRNWAGINLSEKVKEVNLEQFHQLYRELSDLSHVSMRAVHEARTYWIDLNFHPSYVHCSSVLNVVFPCILGILGEYMKYFRVECPCYPTLEKILKRRDELENKKRNS
ncbi:MAG: DUF5677 domain-containing protein [Candidatus Poribacteria bacterium]|nr:DUF5677 domain-containing protein [Candidatus Poribacteria bacterium]